MGSEMQSKDWMRDGATVYCLKRVGCNKSGPIMGKDFWFGIQGGSPTDNEELAEVVAQMLNGNERA